MYVCILMYMCVCVSVHMSTGAGGGGGYIQYVFYYRIHMGTLEVMQSVVVWDS